MGAGHHHLAFRPGSSVVHRLPPYVKLVATFAFVVAVVATPRTQFWAFGLHALLLAGVMAATRLPAMLLLRRMSIELPFIGFALLLPFLATGPEVEVLGIGLSEHGLLGAWNILAKGTLGVGAAVVLAATTELRAMVASLHRLRLPAMLVQIMSFMLRYADVVGDEMRRMRIARESRGFTGRDIRHLKVVAQSTAALFIRSYERGERVYLAMVSRGFTGTMPVSRDGAATRGEWATAGVLPVAAALVTASAWVTR